jgi:uncharacterized damage-inducible protein DinB
MIRRKTTDIGLSVSHVFFGELIQILKSQHMENNTMELTKEQQKVTFMTADILLEHWQGHRRLTRKVIEAFPEDKLFTYSVGGMRPFAELAMETLRMGPPGIKGVVVGTWPTWNEVEKSYPSPKTKEELLKVWDRATDQINSLWPHIAQERFQEVVKMFGQYEGPVWWSVMYFVDNEIHHRAQGYVYLRSLGIEPPHFWER